MTQEIKEITSIADLIGHLKTHQGRYIFRGEPADYGDTSLVPSYGREIFSFIPKECRAYNKKIDINCNIPYDVLQILKKEYVYIEKFYRKLSEFNQIKYEVDICDAQHRGLKTSLLDWSENILVALYFATDHQKNENGYFFALEIRNEMNENIYNDNKGVFDYKILTKCIDKYHIAEEILIIKPPKIGQRISRQLGCFTFHKISWLPADIIYQNFMDDVFGGKVNNFPDFKITKYIVPFNSKEKIREELKICGISEKTLWLKTEDDFEDEAKSNLESLIKENL